MTPQAVERQIQVMQRLIKEKYPDAVFRVVPNPDQEPRTLWLDVFTDHATLSDLSDLIIRKQIELLERNKYLVSVVPQPLKYLPPSVKAESPVEQYATKRKRRPTSLHARERRTRYRTKTNGTRIKRNKKIS